MAAPIALPAPLTGALGDPWFVENVMGPIDRDELSSLSVPAMKAIIEQINQRYGTRLTKTGNKTAIFNRIFNYAKGNEDL
jgi:hypothetical protein